MQGDMIFGGLFALAQGACLGLAFMSYSEANSAFDTSSATIVEAEKGGEFSQDDIDKFTESSTNFIAEKETMTMIYAGAFGGLWLVGSIHAYMTAPSKKASRPRRRRSRSIYGELILPDKEYKLSQTIQADMVTESSLENFRLSPSLSLDLQPVISASYSF
jgi:hypothetical protein